MKFVQWSNSAAPDFWELAGRRKRNLHMLPNFEQDINCLHIASMASQSAAMAWGHQKRWEVVTCYQKQGKQCYNTTAKLCNCSRSFVRKWVLRFMSTGDVQDKPKPGRPCILDNNSAQKAGQLVQQRVYCTAARVAGKLSEGACTPISASTVGRALHKIGMKYKPPIRVPLISKHHRDARVKFCNHNRRRAFKGVMFTDSKYFQMHALKGTNKLRRWEHKANGRRQHATPKSTLCVHAYMGVTYFGVTPLVFVTGTSNQKSAFINPANQQLYRGVCAREYREHVLSKLIPAGQKLFSQSGMWRDKWVFQQDGARVHTQADSKAEVMKRAPGGLLPNWPANSPDLSWIENIWAWMDGELRRRPVCTNLDQFKMILEDIRASIPVKMLQNCVTGMTGHLEKCAERNGRHIGK